MVSSGGGDPPWSSGDVSCCATGALAASSFRGGLRLAALARLVDGRRFAPRRRLAVVRRFPTLPPFWSSATFRSGTSLRSCPPFCSGAAFHWRALFPRRARTCRTFLSLRHMLPPESAHHSIISWQRRNAEAGMARVFAIPVDKKTGATCELNTYFCPGQSQPDHQRGSQASLIRSSRDGTP